MAEEQKEGDVKISPEQKEKPSEAANEPEEQDLVGEAKKVALELKAGLEERKKILEREERLVARQEALRQLGGGSLAGSRTAEKKEETAKEYADRVMSGK